MFVGWVVQVLLLSWLPRSRRLQLQVEKWHALGVGCRRAGPVAVCVFVVAFCSLVRILRHRYHLEVQQADLREMWLRRNCRMESHLQIFRCA